MNTHLLRQRIFAILVIASFVTALGGMQPARAAADAAMLVAVLTPNQDVRAHFDELSLPVYAHLHSQTGEFVLTGMKTGQTQRLTDAQLSFIVLDEDIDQGHYYLAYPPIGRDAPNWDAYGKVLFDGGSVIILRADPRTIEKLPDSGVELAAIRLTDKSKISPVTGAYPSAIIPDPLIQTMINQVTLNNVRAYTGDLSGEWPVTVGGQPYTITTRNTNSGISIQKATQFVGERLSALNLDVEYHQWGGVTYPNVIGELPGLVNPDEIYIIGAHLDDMPSSGRAPGADDNASGSVATLLAADILSQYQWGCTLRFAFWTGEEQGLNGSEAYAQRAHNAGEDILGYLNLDMIAWNDGGSTPGIDLLYNSSMPSTLQLAQLFVDSVDAYNLNLAPQLITSLGGGSDHSSFWDQGYPAILAIEDQNDFNPYYHTINDDMNNFEDWAYYVTFVKAAIGTFAHMSGCLIPTGFGAVQGTVNDASTSLPIENATLTFENRYGGSTHTNSNVSGYYTQTLLADTYTITAKAYGYLPTTVNDIIVIEDEITTQDIALTPIPTYTLAGKVSDSASGFPLLANIVIEDALDLWTDPDDGSYQVSLPRDTYTVEVHANGYHTQIREIDLTSDQVQDFSLEALACILLVDDDDNAPNVQSNYTNAFDALGLDYDLRNLATQGELQTSDLNGYRHVIWFTGDNYNNTLSSNDEAALGSYLDHGGNFLLSSQDYLYSRKITSFGQNYLHLDTNIHNYSFDKALTSVTGANLFAGLGPYNLTYPFGNYSDAIQPDIAAQVAFTGTPQSSATHYNTAIYYAGDTFHTIFLAYPLEAVSPTGRQEILSRTVDFFGGCNPRDGRVAGQVSDTHTGQAISGATLAVAPGEATTTNEQGKYELVLPPGSYDLTVQHACYISETVAGVLVHENSATTRNIALQPLPPRADIQPSTLQVITTGTLPITRSIGVANVGCSTLAYTATITTVSPWLHLDHALGEIAPSADAAIEIALDASGLEPGTYTATLNIETNAPTQTLTTIPVSMTVRACVPIDDLDFEWTPASPLAGDSITFTASATGTQPLAFTWSLDGQEFGAGPTVTLFGAAPGAHEISVNASNACSANVHTSHTLRVWLQKIFLALIMNAKQP